MVDSRVKRTVGYTLSGGFLTVAFGVLGAASAQAKTDAPVSGVPVAGGIVKAADAAKNVVQKAKPAPQVRKGGSPSNGGDSGKQQKNRDAALKAASHVPVVGGFAKAANVAKDVAEKSKAKSSTSPRSSGNAGDQRRNSTSNDKMADQAKVRDKALSVTPFGAAVVKSANAAKNAAERVKAAQPKSQGSAQAVKLKAEDRKAQASARAGARANAVVPAKSLREQIGSTLTEAEESFEAGLKSSRQWAQTEIDDEKNDPNKTPDVGTTVRRFAAGAYAAVHDNVTSAAELLDTLNDSAQGDEEASRKVEQTGKDVADGVVNVVSDPKAAAKKAVAAGEQAWEGFKASPVSGTGEVLANVVGYRAITKSKEGVEAAARAEAPKPRSTTPATGGGKARPSTTVTPSAATAVPAVPKAKAAGPTGRPKVNLNHIEIDGTKYPESVQHIIDNLTPNAKGKYRYEGTVDRPGAKDRRKKSLRGIRRIVGKDRDEWPQAVFVEGGKGASVRHIDPSDNKGSGASLGNQMRGNKAGDYRIDDNTKIRIFVKPPKP
ncbi:NucA/NucB deoxyribonuclease domain-containing protein [Amycolatopsis pittospori]|uniref:NucA/NucB deoxyribonuclease domain-containing protein n=1 Tax=Amycolatopsis pittospori TaxID=2749434 RepID=UPI0015F03594|nr:NucA/NucB deoxyribonuclease domain-containing protein [Amycolatopsis pittospori]